MELSNGNVMTCYEFKEEVNFFYFKRSATSLKCFSCKVFQNTVKKVQTHEKCVLQCSNDDYENITGTLLTRSIKETR